MRFSMQWHRHAPPVAEPQIRALDADSPHRLISAGAMPAQHHLSNCLKTQHVVVMASSASVPISFHSCKRRSWDTGVV